MTLSRKHGVIALFVMIGALLAFDLSHSAPLDPFRALPFLHWVQVKPPAARIAPQRPGLKK